MHGTNQTQKSHLAAVKKIIKYVNGKIEFGLCYSCDSTATLMGYYDAHWAGNSDDKKSTSGGCSFLGKNLVFWFSKKQNCISLLTGEVEYIAAESSCSQLIWMRNMLNDYGVPPTGASPSMTLRQHWCYQYFQKPGSALSHQTYHIRHHFIRSLVEDRVIG